MARRSSALPGHTALGLLIALALLGGCGTGSTVVQGFFFQAIGGAGGVAAAGEVHLTIPPGALAAATGVGVLPEPGPLPLAPLFPDPCIYTYLGPIWCIGPIGVPLLVNGVLRMSYDETQIPAGFTEADLVLLIWDNIAGVMRPKTGPSVTQDTVNNVFIDTGYNELGHVAIGIRDCGVGGNVLVQNNPMNRAKPAEGGQADPPPELYVVDPLELVLPAFVPTGSLVFDSFLASPSGSRVLLRVSDPINLGFQLMTVPLGSVGPPTPIAASDVLTNRFLQSYDPLFGWLRGASSDEVFYMLYDGSAASGLTASVLEFYRLFRRVGDGSAPAVLMHSASVPNRVPDDLRQDPSTGTIMLRYLDFMTSFGDIWSLESPSGAVLQAGFIPPNFGGMSPRWVTTPIAAPFSNLYVRDFISDPGSSSSDPSQVVFGDTWLVDRYLGDSGFEQTIFSVDASSGDFLQDFALAPDDETFAAVVDVGTINKGQRQQVIGETQLWMGTLTEGVLAIERFGDFYTVNELVWHPQGTGVFLDLDGYSVSHYSLQDNDGDYIQQNFIPITSLSQLDVNRVDGRILILLPGQIFPPLNLPPNAEGPPPAGLYVSIPPDASDFQYVDMLGLFDPFQARWVQSWRHQPGMDGPWVR